MDLERQQDELLAIESIYDSSIFTSTHDTHPEGMFQAQVDLSNDFHIVTENTNGDQQDKIILKHLPPIVLRFSLPLDYPSESPPYYMLSCSWLNRCQLSKLCAKLDEIWEENKCEIIYLWTDFLKTESSSFLGFTNSLDISHLEKSKFKCKEMVTDQQVKSDVAKGSQPPTKRIRKPARDRGDGLYDQRVFVEHIAESCLLPHLIEYNQQQIESVFSKKLFDCGVCFQQKFGYQSLKFQNCDHVYCKECMAEYFRVQIDEGNVKCLNCPNEKCNSIALQNQIKELVGSEVFKKYDKLLLNSTLDTMKDIVYCPRISCQCPVIADKGNLASCSSCSFAFCIFCKRAYHGIAPCRLEEAEIKNLTDVYLNGTENEKLGLEKKYGRRNMQKIVEDYLANDYIMKNSKRCPQCRCNIEKIDGCHKMTCWNCQSYFCWLCNKLLNHKDPYLHYRDRSNKCFEQLFHGIDFEDYDDFL